MDSEQAWIDLPARLAKVCEAAGIPLLPVD